MECWKKLDTAKKTGQGAGTTNVTRIDALNIANDLHMGVVIQGMNAFMRNRNSPSDDTHKALCAWRQRADEIIERAEIIVEQTQDSVAAEKLAVAKRMIKAMATDRMVDFSQGRPID